MKTFITFSPQQAEGFLHAALYLPAGNPALEYGETRFPIIPVINGYTLQNEEIRVIVLCQDHERCVNNLKYLRQELESVFQTKNLRAAATATEGELFELVMVPFSDKVTDHVETFQKLIDRIQDGDDLHACITYGSKPAPMVELMAMRYARQIKKDTYISCIVYGQLGRGGDPSYIHDETALAHLDDLIRILAMNGDPNPKATLDRIIGK